MTKNTSQEKDVATVNVNAVVRQLVNNPKAMYEVLEELSKKILFGDWVVDDEGAIRPEVNKTESRITVWKYEDEKTKEIFYSWRIGFGVIGLAGHTSIGGIETVEKAMEEVDSILSERKHIILVN